MPREVSPFLRPEHHAPRRFRVGFLLFLLLLSGGAAAQGGDAPPPGEPRRDAALFRSLDRHDDGFLSVEELESEAARGADWVVMDINGDGWISLEEFTALRRS